MLLGSVGDEVNVSGRVKGIVVEHEVDVLDMTLERGHDRAHRVDELILFTGTVSQDVPGAVA
jgi:hypothetical protein